MDEFIKRKEVYKAAVEKTNNPACPVFVAANILQSIVDIPAADVGPVRHGHWKISVRTRASKKGNFEDIYCYNCSFCGKSGFHITKYCPNCGAKMNKEHLNDR